MQKNIPCPLGVELPAQIDLVEAARYFGARGQPDPGTLALLERCAEPLLKAAKEYGAEIIYQYNNLNGIALRIPDGGNISEAIKYFKAVEGVLSVSQDRQWRLL